MTEAALLITAIATLITAVATLVLSLRNGEKIEEIHVATNSMKDQLVAATASASKAEGNLVGRAELKQEQKSQ